MGFEAKLIILRETKAKAEVKGPKGEEECTLWKDSSFSIDFGHITRLEKVVSERYAHMDYGPFRRAGICVVSCFETHILSGWESKLDDLLMPEMAWKNFGIFGEADSLPTTQKIGGKTYVDGGLLIHHTRLLLKRKEASLVERHNSVVALNAKGRRKAFASARFFEPIFTWSSCIDLARWLAEEEKKHTELWQAVIKDPFTLAVVTGWRRQLEMLGKLGARGMLLLE